LITVKIVCIFLGFICDLACGNTVEVIDLPEERATVRNLLKILIQKYTVFEETFIDQRTGEMNPKRQILLRLHGSPTMPITALKSLDTELSEGSRVVFW
jgi:molybdopterin converting factor small subunit